MAKSVRVERTPPHTPILPVFLKCPLSKCRLTVLVCLDWLTHILLPRINQEVSDLDFQFIVL